MLSNERIAIVGSGFAGSILARALQARGLRATLLERSQHPRFALGESSTPLASICLERMARDFGLPDLDAMAAWSRWEEALPNVTHGLKRGFSFYSHLSGEEYRNGPQNDRRLLVAASPDDEIADSHWLRADVDLHLVERAVEEGVRLIDECDVQRITGTAGDWTVHCSRAGRPIEIKADFVVDGSGGGHLFEDRRSGAASGHLRTGLVFGHFQNVGSFVDSSPEAYFGDSPYPEERAAVHHLLEEGWMYVLRFDTGLVSAGFVLDYSHPSVPALLRAPPSEAWSQLLVRYPSLQRQLSTARPVRPIGSARHLQRMAIPTATKGWAPLPHTVSFTSPLFSTGIAWGLVGVERLVHALTAEGGERERRLAEYTRLVRTEALHIRDLQTGAYQLRSDFSQFAAWSQIYFIAASYAEARQRLADPPSEDGWRAEGFLGSNEPAIQSAVQMGPDALPSTGSKAFVYRQLEALDVAGIGTAPAASEGTLGRAPDGDPNRRNIYPVDLTALVRHAGKLGLNSATVRARLGRLRGGC